MSLEAALQANTAALASHTNALRELLAALGHAAREIAAPNPTETPAEPAAPKARGKGAKAQPAQTAPAQPTAEAQAAAAPESKAEPSPASAPAAESANPGAVPDYQTVAKAVTALAQAKGREAAVAVLAQFGATRLPDVPTDRLGEVLTACQAAQAEVAEAV